MAVSGRAPVNKMKTAFVELDSTSSSSGSTLYSNSDSGADSTAESDLISLCDDWSPACPVSRGESYYDAPRTADYDYPTDPGAVAATLPVGQACSWGRMTRRDPSFAQRSGRPKTTSSGLSNPTFVAGDDTCTYVGRGLSGSLFDGERPPDKPPRSFLQLSDTIDHHTPPRRERALTSGSGVVDDLWADDTARPRPVDKFRRASLNQSGGTLSGTLEAYEEVGESELTHAVSGGRRDPSIRSKGREEGSHYETGEGGDPLGILMEPGATKKAKKVVNSSLGAVPKKITALGRRFCSTVAEGTASAFVHNKKLSASLVNLLEAVSTSGSRSAQKWQPRSNKQRPKNGRMTPIPDEECEQASDREIFPSFTLIEQPTNDGGFCSALCVYVDGPMGVGKSTLIKALAKNGGDSVIAFKEPTHYVRRIYGDVLKLIYHTVGSARAGRASASYRMFSAQMKFGTALATVPRLIERCTRWTTNLTAEDKPCDVRGLNWCVIDMHPLSSAIVYPLTLLRQGALNFDNFTSLVSTMKCGEGDVVVFLGLPPKALMRRVKSRGRDVERSVSLRYLEELCISFYTVRVTALLLEVVSVTDMVKFCFGALTVRDLVDRYRTSFDGAGMTESRFRILVSQSLSILIKNQVLQGASCPTLLVVWTAFFETLRKLTLIYLSALDFEDNLDAACAAIYRVVASHGGIKPRRLHWEHLRRAAVEFNHLQ